MKTVWWNGCTVESSHNSWNSTHDRWLYSIQNNFLYIQATCFDPNGSHQALICVHTRYKFKSDTTVYYTKYSYGSMFWLYWVIIRPSKEQIQCIKFYSAFWDPKRLQYIDTMDLFFRRPDDDSVESKHVAIRIFCVINCCVWLIFIPCMT